MILYSVVKVLRTWKVLQQIIPLSVFFPPGMASFVLMFPSPPPHPLIRMRPANARWVTSNVVDDRYYKRKFNKSAMIVFCLQSFRSRCLFFLSSSFIDIFLNGEVSYLVGKKIHTVEGGGGMGMKWGVELWCMYVRWCY